MEDLPENKEGLNIVLRPSALYAFLHIVPFAGVSVLLLLAAWYLFAAFIYLSFIAALFTWYRFFLVRCTIYRFTEEVLEITTGLFFKRTDSTELFRVKDYVVTQNLLMQLFGLMNFALITTDWSDRVIVLKGIPRSDLPNTLRGLMRAAANNGKIVELN